MRGAPVLCCDCPQCGSTIGAPSWKRQRLSVDHVLLSIRSVGSDGERKRELHGSFARSHDIRRRGDDEFRLYETCGASLEKSSTVCFRDNRNARSSHPIPGRDDCGSRSSGGGDD